MSLKDIPKGILRVLSFTTQMCEKDDSELHIRKVIAYLSLRSAHGSIGIVQ
jgi:hypothetical protein